MGANLLFVPGNNPSMVQNADILGADTVIFDLEDAVARDQKDAARKLLQKALQSMAYEGCETSVRINAMDTPFWKEDLLAMAEARVQGLVIPKAERAEDLKKISDILDEVPGAEGIFLIPLVESALGVENVYEIAKSTKRIRGIFFGAEDYTADIGTSRTKEGAEILWARGRVVNGAAAAGVESIDTPFTDLEDMEGLRADTLFAKGLGFDGKASISPRHCGIIKEIFRPKEEEVAHARRVIEAVKAAEEAGKGVVSMDGKMIDKPIVLRALRVLSAAGIKEDFCYE